MSVESDRSRKRTFRKGNVVTPEAASDQSTMQNVFEFLHDYVPQAVSGHKEVKKERVLWAWFESGDVNDLSMPHLHEGHQESRSEGGFPLLLTLGFNNGYSIWMILPDGDAHEVYCCFGEGEIARTVRLLKTPEKREGVALDVFADKRPIIAVVRKGRHSTSGSTVAYSTMQLISLRGSEDNGGNILKKYIFKTWPIVDVKCNRRVVAIVFQKRIVVLDAGSLENRLVIKNNYPCPGFPCNPITLGPRWLAYSETKLSSKHQSVGGMSHTTISSVATTMLKNVRKGISALTETISGLTTKAQTTSLETTDKSQQQVDTADVITVIDIGQKFPENLEMRLDDLGEESAVIAHFVAHAGPDVHIAGLAFNPSGNLLLSASTEGHTFHVFQILPHPFLSSETAVHHLYTLYRGATSGVVQDMAFSFDSRWVAVSTLNGTTHVFPISPYGGDPTVRTHTPSKVVNKMSRFHTSAGIDSIAVQSHTHNSVSNAKNLILKSNHQPHAQLSQSPPQSSFRDSPSIPSYMNGYNSWNNPRSLPLPTPISITALQQIKQPYQSSSVLGGTSSNRGVALTLNSSGSRGDVLCGGEPYVTLAGPDVVCVRAIFGLPSNAGEGRLNSEENGASYSLYIVGGNGVLVKHQLEPQKLSSAPEGEDAPIELLHYSKICWRLMGNPPAVTPGSISLPLKEDNPLIIANDAYKMFCQNCKYVQRNEIPTTSSTELTTLSDDKWLSQVEILTHAPPSRRLWMGPQFSFKTYQSLSSSPNISNSVSSINLIKTPSPPNTIIYSGSLNSFVSSQVVIPQASTSTTGCGGSGERTGDQTAVLFPSAESPLVDFFLEPSEMQSLSLKCIDTSPIPMQGTTGRIDSAELGQGNLDRGVLEVFGSWTKVAPHYEGAPFEGELERQLQDAMGEHETSSITIVAKESRIKTGFSPPGP